MGKVFSKIKAALFGPPPKEFRLLLLGLDSAGKTSMHFEHIYSEIVDD